jgi:Heterokaryon incompatibility protein (HET)
MQLYPYVPLQRTDSIRVLILRPGEKFTPIRISLHEVRFEDAPQYEALSYTWATEDGDASLSQKIDCEGSTIRITKTCEAALRRLREKDNDRALWVDAICINQHDIKERGRQVGIMGDVYSKAVRVLVWLGPESDDENLEISHPVSDLFIGYLHRMASEMEELKNASQSARASPLYQRFISDIYASVVDGKQSPLSQGFNYIKNRRWWKRIWVLQEVVVAKSAIVICGEKSTGYSDFHILYGALRKGADHNREENVTWLALGISRKHLSLYPESRSHHTPPVILHRILRRGQDLEAADPRDHIFGLLGLSEDFKSILPKADYNRNLVNVFTDVTKGMLNYSKSLHAISVVTPGESTEGFPSWVTVWSNPMTHNFQDWNDNSYHAARDSQAIYAFSDNDTELKVVGKFIDTVAIGPLLDSSAYYLHGTEEEAIPGWRESCRHGFSLESYPTGERVQEAVWRSLCWNKAGGKHPAAAATQNNFEEWYRIIAAGKSLEDTVKEVWALPNAFWRVVNTPSPLCTTTNGYLASAPYTTKSGDCIAVLTGGRAPFILRPVDSFYQLVGPCYIHGIMKGEAFPIDQGELEWISIR